MMPAVQGAWKMDGMKKATEAALLAIDPQADAPFRNQACPLYAAVARGTAVPA